MANEDENSVDLTATLGHLGLPSVIVSREGRITWMNEAARSLFGDLEGVIALTHTVAPEHAALARREFERKLDGVPFTDYEVDVITRDGLRARAMVSSLTSLIGNHGAYAVFALMAIDAVFPAASELVMVYAGALAAGAFAGQHVDLFGTRISSHLWAYVVMALAGTLGYLVGSIVGWAIGFYGGRPLLGRHGRWLHLSPQNLDRAEHWFDRWDDLAVLIGRVTPVVRSFISIPAGIFRMPFWRYTVLTLIGSAIWAFALAGAGYGLGRSYERFHHDFGYVEYAIVAAIVGLAAYLLVRWRRSSRLSDRASDPAG